MQAPSTRAKRRVSLGDMDSLVSTSWLASELGSPDLVILDASLHLPAAARDAAAEFAESHIPGARFFDLTQLTDKTSDVPAAHPRPEQLAQALAALGVTANSRIVIYDDSMVKTAARAWFLLHAHGIENAAILDGGIAKWRSEGRAVENGMPAPVTAEPMTLTAPTRIRYKAEMLANLDSGEAQILDARDAARFAGEVADGGHIPGSCNLPFPKLFNADGTYKVPVDLSTELEAAGITAGKPVTATCGSGVTACVLLFALHLTGRSDTALYDGSWSEWGSDPATPKGGKKA